jgi:hypothetical protein
MVIAIISVILLLLFISLTVSCNRQQFVYNQPMAQQYVQEPVVVQQPVVVHHDSGVGNLAAGIMLGHMMSQPSRTSTTIINNRTTYSRPVQAYSRPMSGYRPSMRVVSRSSPMRSFSRRR